VSERTACGAQCIRFLALFSEPFDGSGVEAEAKFLRLAHEAGCKILFTVLGPRQQCASDSFASGPSRAEDVGLQIGLARSASGFANVRFWHLADIDAGAEHVRFGG
jgi:hypothetical protein